MVVIILIVIFLIVASLFICKNVNNKKENNNTGTISNTANNPVIRHSTDDSKEILCSNSNKELLDPSTLSLSTTGESQAYKDKLLDTEWINKRNRILNRDKHKCQHCFNIVELNTFEELRGCLTMKMFR